MADVQTQTLYEQDFYLWALDQVRDIRALRDAAAGQGDLAPALAAIDWDDLIEEIDGLAKRDRRELQSRATTIIEHLVRLELSSANDPRAGWVNTVRRERREVDLLLRQSPSLRREIADFLHTDAIVRIADQTITDLIERGETSAPGRVRVAGRHPALFTESQILDDWWPDRVEPAP